MRIQVLLALVAAILLESECRRPAEQDFWSGTSVDARPGAIQDIQDLPGNDVVVAEPLDKIQVMSSAIRVLPRPLRTRTRRSSVRTHKDPALKKQHPHVVKTKTHKTEQAEELSKNKGPSKRQRSLSGHSIPRHPHSGKSLKISSKEDVTKSSTGKRHNKKALARQYLGPNTQSSSKRHNKKKSDESSSKNRSSKGHDSRKHHAFEYRTKKTKTGEMSSLDFSPKIDVKPSSTRRHKREIVSYFRRPREFQFVTNKLDRLSPPPIARVYPPNQRDERVIDRGFRKAQRRIIYYASLPEIVRPPVQWYPSNDYYDNPRQPYAAASSTIYSPSKSSYPSYSPSENDITRVQSNIIDVTNSRFPSYSAPPKFTIIDVEPPYYNRPPFRLEPPNRYNDFRTPPYRDYSHFPSQNFHSDPPLEPVKLQTPPPDTPSSYNSTETPANSTRFLPDVLPVNLRSLSKFIT